MQLVLTEVGNGTYATVAREEKTIWLAPRPYSAHMASETRARHRRLFPMPMTGALRADAVLSRSHIGVRWGYIDKPHYPCNRALSSPSSDCCETADSSSESLLVQTSREVCWFRQASLGGQQHVFGNVRQDRTEFEVTYSAAYRLNCICGK